MSFIADGLLTFRRHAKKSHPDIPWIWRSESRASMPETPYVLIEEVDRSVNQPEDLRAVGADGEMEFYEHVRSMVRLMFVSDSPQKSMGMAHKAWRCMRLQSFMMDADYDGIAVGPPTGIQTVQLPDYSSGEMSIKAVAMTTVRVSYVEIYRDNLGVIKHAEAHGKLGELDTTLILNNKE